LEVDVQQSNFKILQLLPQVLILFLVEKWIPPSRSETAKIGQKTEGILGVNQPPMNFLPPIRTPYRTLFMQNAEKAGCLF
jgi:hypothetical protein